MEGALGSVVSAVPRGWLMPVVLRMGWHTCALLICSASSPSLLAAARKLEHGGQAT